MALGGVVLPASAALPPGGLLAAAATTAALVLLLPRAGWLLAVGASAAWLAGSGLEGLAVLLVAAALPVPLLLPRRGVLWSTPALAPLLAVPGLALLWPALAGQARGGWRRGALGALGLWWILLAEPLARPMLLLGDPRGLPLRSVWEGSAQSAWSDVLVPLASSGALALAAVFAGFAWGLPLVVRGLRAETDLVGAVGWAAGLAAATGAVAASVSGLPGADAPRGLVVGAVVAAAVALLAAAGRRR